MDSKVVSAEIRTHIRPYLKSIGFKKFTGRNAWRLHDDRVDIVSFQSFNTITAEVVGCTTFSFSIRLGTYFRYIPPVYADEKNDPQAPKFAPRESICHFRGGLQRSFEQPELSRKDIWFLDFEKYYLKPAIDDALQALQSAGVAWFNRFSDVDEVLRTLLEAREDMDKLFGFGRFKSPSRLYKTAYVAKQAGRAELAKETLLAAAEMEYYKWIRDRLIDDANSL